MSEDPGPRRYAVLTAAVPGVRSARSCVADKPPDKIQITSRCLSVGFGDRPPDATYKVRLMAVFYLDFRFLLVIADFNPNRAK